MGAAAMWDEPGGRRQPATFTCLSAGRRPGEILYALSTGTVSGLFAYDLETGDEKRLARDADGTALSLATSTDHGVLAFARRQKNGSCNLAVMRDDGGEWALVTDGDTVDGSPSWVPVAPGAKDGRHQLVFHCAGIGRDAAGMIAGLGPAEIHLLDAEHGQPEDARLEPEARLPRARHGARRHALRDAPPLPLGAARGRRHATLLKDGLLAPFRLAYAGFRYLDFFSMKYSEREAARHEQQRQGQERRRPTPRRAPERRGRRRRRGRRGREPRPLRVAPRAADAGRRGDDHCGVLGGRLRARDRREPARHRRRSRRAPRRAQRSRKKLAAARLVSGLVAIG